jgi:fructokinase
MPYPAQVNHEVVRLAKRHRLLIAFDPNIRIRLWESEEKSS